MASYLPAVRYGGTIVSVHGLARALSARGHDVHVFTTSVDGPRDSAVAHGTPVNLDGVNVWYFRSPRLRRIFWAPDLGDALRARVSGFDVVHTHAIFLWPMWAAARAARRANIPYVVSPRGMLERELIARKNPLMKGLWIAAIERRNLERASAIHVTSAREAREAESFGFRLPQIAEVPNGVDPAPVPVPEMSADLAARVGTEPFVLFLGRLEWKKGLDRLMAALPLAPGVRVVIAGNDETGYQSVVEKLAAQAGVRDRVRFVGAVFGPDKWALLARAQLLVLPSYSENFGNVVLEAFASSCPVVVTSEVGVAPMVSDSGAGRVVEGTPSALAHGLVQLTAVSGESISARARAKALAGECSWASVAERMETLYESLRP